MMTHIVSCLSPEKSQLSLNLTGSCSSSASNSMSSAQLTSQLQTLQQHAVEVGTPCTPGDPLQQLHHKQKVCQFHSQMIFVRKIDISFSLGSFSLWFLSNE